MKLWRVFGTVAFAAGTITGTALAAQPTKGDMDYCDHKAAQVSKGAPIKPDAGTTPPAAPPPGSNPADRRVTDSTQSGTSAPPVGIAPSGEEPVYRQTYLACIHERAK